MTPRPSITAIVITRDEVGHVERCIGSLLPAVARIVVVDSGSTDGTREVARELGADVYENAWTNHSNQLNWALDHCAITTDWVLRLDADEYLEPALQRQLVGGLDALPPSVHGVLLARKYHFLGRWIRHGGMHPLYHLRLWRNGSARIEPRWMDEHAVLGEGESARLEGAFVDDNRRDITWWSQKHLRYATLEAVQAALDELDPLRSGLEAPQQRLEGAAASKRWLKQHVYNKLPPGLGPLLYFQYRYLLRFGFLDGWPGLAFHFLQGCWYRVIVDLRRRELAQVVKGETSLGKRIDALERATGLRLRDSLPGNAQGGNA